VHDSSNGHNSENTERLVLKAVCDLNQKRLNKALKDLAALKAYGAVEKMVDDPEVDLVIVASCTDLKNSKNTNSAKHMR